MVFSKRSKREDVVQTSEETALLNELNVLEFVTVSILNQRDGYKLQNAVFPKKPGEKFYKRIRRGKARSPRLRLGLLDCGFSSLQEARTGLTAAVVILLENHGKLQCLCSTIDGIVDVGRRSVEGWSCRWTITVERKAEAGDLVCEIKNELGQVLRMDWTWLAGFLPIEPRILQVDEKRATKENHLWEVYFGENRRVRKKRVLQLPDWSSGFPGLLIILMICWLYGAVKVIIGILVFFVFVFGGTYYKHWRSIYG